MCYYSRRKLSSAGEHSLHRGGVMGSNPIVSTIYIDDMVNFEMKIDHVIFCFHFLHFYAHSGRYNRFVSMIGKTGYFMKQGDDYGRDEFE